MYNGEFGPVYASADENGMSAKQANKPRIALLNEQIAIYAETHV